MQTNIYDINLNFEFFTTKTLNLINHLQYDKDSIEYKVLQYQAGDENAFNFIFDKYKSMLERVSIRKGNKDLFGELIEALWNAVKTFKAEYGVKFNTYYWKCANNHLGILNIRKNAKKRQSDNNTISLNKTVNNSDNDSDMESFIEDKSCNGDFDNVLFNTFLEKNIFPILNESEVKTIEMLLKGYTLEEIGEQLGGLTAPAIHVKLRRLANKPVIGKQLKELYNFY